MGYLHCWWLSRVLLPSHLHYNGNSQTKQATAQRCVIPVFFPVYFLLWNTVISQLWNTVISQLMGNTVISHFSGTQSFFNLGEHSFSTKSHLLRHMRIKHGEKSEKKSHFYITWNTVICQLGKTQSFLGLVEHSHFIIWWNKVIFI